jgi:uncharacterized membrane protein
MKISVFWFLKITLVGTMFFTGWYLLDILPEEFPMHWNYRGEVDRYMAKEKGIYILPFLTLGLTLFFPLLQKIDPRKEKYQQFRKPWEIFQLLFVVFFAYIYFISLYIALHPDLSMNTFMLSGIGVLFIVLGNYMGKIRQNYFVGIKTPWTLHNEMIWNKTHRLGAWCFVLGGFVFLAEAYYQ